MANSTKIMIKFLAMLTAILHHPMYLFRSTCLDQPVLRHLSRPRPHAYFSKAIFIPVRDYLAHSRKIEKVHYSKLWTVAAGIVAASIGLWVLSTSKKQLPKYTLKDLEEHGSVDKGLWIAWQDPQDKLWYISSMADFVSSHPGGNQMLAAGGKAVMPFWQRFARHLDSAGNPTAVVLKELRSRIVGNLDTPPDEASITDPYLFEPDRSDTQLKLLQQRPYNAGQDHSQLKDFITEIPQVFIRHHGPAPLLKDYALEIEGPKGTSYVTLETLTRFPVVTYLSVLQCTGHRRSEMPNTNGLQWEASVANVEVTGYRLWDILKEMGFERDQNFYLFVEQLDEKKTAQYSTCIPIQKLPEDTLLITEMNGEPLNRDHGAPLRLLVPGFYGNFSVKKPERMKILSKDEIPQEQIEKYAPLGIWAPAVAMSPFLANYVEHRTDGMFIDPELRVNSLGTVDGERSAVEQAIVLEGWAWSGGGREILKVEISADFGISWKEAKIDPLVEQPKGRRYAWTKWSASTPFSDFETVLVRATDSQGNVQPRQATWNPRGLRHNSWTKIFVKSKEEI